MINVVQRCGREGRQIILNQNERKREKAGQTKMISDQNEKGTTYTFVASILKQAACDSFPRIFKIFRRFQRFPRIFHIFHSSELIPPALLLIQYTHLS